MSLGNRLLFLNGVVSHAVDIPLVTTLLEVHPGAYTTTRTHRNCSEILFWNRHLQRLTNSFKLLLKSDPKFLFEKPENNKGLFLELSNRAITWDSVIRCLINDSMGKAMPFVLKGRESGKEIAITILVSGNSENLSCLEDGFDERRVSEVLDVYMHVDTYVSPVFGVGGNGARLAVVGRGRDLANAKYSEWVRLRKSLEKLRPPSVTELLLSNDGDQILEGCLTNFFVVCWKIFSWLRTVVKLAKIKIASGNLFFISISNPEKDDGADSSERNGLPTLSSFEVQTAPLGDGVLPGVIRQVIRDICLKIGIPFREIAPSWSQRELWTEAFITNSLRLLQHVEAIQTPSTWKYVESKIWEEITWAEKQFEDVPGRITSIIQRHILEQAGVEAFPVVSFEDE